MKSVISRFSLALIVMLFSGCASLPESPRRTSFDEIIKKAYAGDAHSQAILGSVYRKGEMGVKKDYPTAIRYLASAIKNKDGLAIYMLGVMYENGEKVSKDVSKAEILYAAAVPLLQQMAEEGDARSQACLGSLFKDGKGGVEKNSEEAFKLVKKSAKQGCVSGQYALGCCYLNGIGVSVDNDKGFEWIKKAASQGDAASEFLLGKCCAEGIGVKKDMSKACRFFSLAAEQGNNNAQYALADAYHKGDGVEQDFNKAAEWYIKFINNIEETGGFTLQQISPFHVLIGMDYARVGKEKESAEWLFKAQKSGDPEAVSSIKGFLASGDLPKSAPNLKAYMAALEKGMTVVNQSSNK